jgi:ABC-2 type transport system permease protein
LLKYGAGRGEEVAVKAMIVKEFRQMRRDRRTMALLFVVPVLVLTVFGYAARFDVKEVPTAIVGATPPDLLQTLGPGFKIVERRPGGDEASARRLLRDSKAHVAFVASAGGTDVLIDGTELFSAQSALRRVGGLPRARVSILYNADLSTATVMIPAIIGFILLFVGLFITSLGVVREREQGTLEQFAITPLRPVEVILGKIAPYFVIAFLNLVLSALAGLIVFGVPFRGSLVLFAAFGLAFLFAVLGLGVLVSTASRTQGEAVQLAILLILPQVMVSGMVFPLQAMPAGTRWLGSIMPLTYFIIGMRSILLKAAPLQALWFPLAVLVVMAAAVFVLAVLRFRRELSITA